MRRWALLIVAGCTGLKSAPVRPGREVLDTGIARLASAHGDAAAIEDMLQVPLAFGGMWFEDPTCRAMFGQAGVIERENIRSFARCLAGLHLGKSERTNPLPDMAVLTYGPGLEVELLFEPTYDSAKLRWIGYVSRRNTQDGSPTITQAAFEANRVESAPELDATTRKALDEELAAHPKMLGHYAWMKVCVDASGAITSVMPRAVTSTAALAAFMENVKQWKLHPFVLGGQPTPVCSLVNVEYPAGASKGKTFPYPLPPEFGDAVTVVYEALPERVSGDLHSGYDRAIQYTRAQHKRRDVSGLFFFCIANDGTTTRAAVTRSTNVIAIDKSVLSDIAEWRFEPIAEGQQGLANCAFARFAYSAYSP